MVIYIVFTIHPGDERPEFPAKYKCIQLRVIIGLDMNLFLAYII